MSAQPMPGAADDVLAILWCPICAGSLAASVEAAGRDVLACAKGHRFPVVRGVPRFVQSPTDPLAARTQASFGYEWTHFNDWRASGESNFNDYFAGLDLASLRNACVLDAGCGMGRHARQIAAHARQVIAVDFSSAIDQAARTTSSCENVQCVQADLLALPVADNAFDYVYSLGVLHHLDRTEDALRALVGKLKPGGRMRIYLYWKKHGWSGRLLRLVTAARRVTTQLPFALLRALCWLLSIGLYAAVVLPYRLAARLGITVHRDWPLFVYSKYPFAVLYNDQFDRFSAPIEKRYDADEVRDLLERAGLDSVTVRPCFGWVAEAVKR
jgi:SAM-dependent methyltransferase